MYGPRAGHSGATGSNENYQNSSLGYSENSIQGSGWISAFSTSGYEGEDPLLEELGVNFSHIKEKTLIVLNPISRRTAVGGIDQHVMDDSDLGGPILFCLLFGTFLLLAGKIHFGYVYGVAFIGSVSIHFIFSMMATVSTTFSKSASVLGYCLLPLVLTSALSVAMSMDGLIGYIISAVAVCWCTLASSGMFVSVLQMTDMRLLVAYPLALFYSVFALMTIFAERQKP